jgi:hypothetical protein
MISLIAYHCGAFFAVKYCTTQAATANAVVQIEVATTQNRDEQSSLLLLKSKCSE